MRDSAPIICCCYIDPPRQRYPAGKDVLLHQRLEQAFAAVPGVQAVTAAWRWPTLADSMTNDEFHDRRRRAQTGKAARRAG